MDSRAALPLNLLGQRGSSFVEFSFLHNLSKLPMEFLWPKDELVSADKELMEPEVDLEGFFKGDEEETWKAAEMIKAACLNHGFFQVINHGVDLNLISAAHRQIDRFFNLPTSEKIRARRMPGSLSGYSGAHADRYSSKLPWKETLSFGYHENSSDPVVLDFFKITLGEDFVQTG